jgi:transposase InsO family protein
MAAVIAVLGAKHKFIKPPVPWQNGKVERFNRTLATEWTAPARSPVTTSGPPRLPLARARQH